MKFLDLEIYNDFKCIGSECPFSCCGGGWGIIIDPETDAYYKTVTGEIGDRLERSITRKEGNSNFTLTKDGNCPFLNEEKLCDIYSSLGEEHLCYTCKTYPRYNFLSGDILFSGVSISCPEVARFFLSHTETLKIDFAEDNSEIQNETDMDWDVFNNSDISVSKWQAAYSVFDEDDEQIWQEQLLVYSLYRYFMQGTGDNKFFEKYVAGVILVFQVYLSTLSLYYLKSGDIPDYEYKVMCVSHISRVIEHSEGFRDTSVEHFKELGMTDPIFLLRLLS